MFLDRGLVIYLKGENALLDAIRSLDQSSAKVSGH